MLNPGDTPIAGVLITLSDGQFTFTDANGNYTFTVPAGTYTVTEVNPANYWSTAALPGTVGSTVLTTDSTRVTVASGQSSLNNDFLDAVDSDGDLIPDPIDPRPSAYDPSGYLYDENTGQILPGGLITVTGPGVVSLILDGSTGKYEYLTDGTPGVYTITVTPPPGYIPSPTRLPGPGPYNPNTAGTNPVILGNPENSGNPGFLTSNAPTPFYYTFLLSDPGDPFVINNNYPFTFSGGSYTVTKQLNTPDNVRVGEPISFTIRITNTGAVTITTLPLQDVYDDQYLTFGYVALPYSTPDSDDINSDGQIDWSDLTQAAPNGFDTDLGPGFSFTVIVTFTAKADTTALPNNRTTNTARVDGAEVDPDGPGPILPVPLPIQEDDALVRIIRPTGLGVGAFSAVAEGDAIRVAWQTASEARIAGFNVLRAESTGGILPAADAYQAVNGSAILATQAGSDQGASYSYRDEATTPGVVYHYRLQILRTDGGMEVYGDAEATVAPRRVYAPMIIR